MNTLSITSPDGQTLVSVQIGALDPAEATVVILTALANLKPKRKRRSDAGKPKATT